MPRLPRSEFSCVSQIQFRNDHGFYIKQPWNFHKIFQFPAFFFQHQLFKIHNNTKKKDRYFTITMAEQYSLLYIMHTRNKLKTLFYCLVWNEKQATKKNILNFHVNQVQIPLFFPFKFKFFSKSCSTLFFTINNNQKSFSIKITQFIILQKSWEKSIKYKMNIENIYK
jgi:hypothetical protein